MVGNVDAGKSTLLGVLTHGELDNGRGFARQKLFRHKHEMESGRTSSVGNDILGFDQEGQVEFSEVAKRVFTIGDHCRGNSSCLVVNHCKSSSGLQALPMIADKWTNDSF